jgi:RNase P subunit RPR2
MALLLNPQTDVCTSCGKPVEIIDRVRDYSTTRGPMAEHVVTRCTVCGQQHLLHLAAQQYREPARLG